MTVISSKILMIHPRYREYRSELFTTLSNNFEIDFLFIVNADEQENKPPNNISYRCLNLQDKRIFPNEKGPGLKLIGSLRLIYLLSKEIIISPSHVIITSTENSFHSQIAFIWSKILRKKFILWTETWNIHKNRNLFSKVLKICSNFFLNKADAVLVHGTNQKKYCISIGIPEKRMFLFNHCSTDKSKLPIKENIRQKLNIQYKKIVLFIGRLIKLKGLEILLKAYKKLENEMNDITLISVGTGNYENNLKNLARDLRIRNITFYGFASPDLIPSFFSAADVFCLPSYTHNGHGGEGWGLVINEAASMSLPIVTTDAVGSSPDLVKNGYNGFIVKNGNINELYEALKKLLSNDELREKMKSNSRKIFEKFNDFNKVVNNLRKAIEFVENKK